MSSSPGGSSQPPPQGRITPTQTPGKFDEIIVRSDIVPSFLHEIEPIIDVAKKVEKSNPRVAYLCRFYASEKAHRLDPTCRGTDVYIFKIALHLRLKREHDPTLKKSDVNEIRRFYQHHYQNYIQGLPHAAWKGDIMQLTVACRTANVLYEVLEAVYTTQSIEVDQEILKIQDEVAEKSRIYVPYNILPLDPYSRKHHPLMQRKEFQAIDSALRNTRGLPWPKDHRKKRDDL